MPQVKSNVVKSRGRVGRPPVYKGAVARHIVSLIRRTNGVTARAILNAPVNEPLSKERSAKFVPKPLGISLPTIYRLAERAGITLRPGVRRSVA